MQVTTEKLTTDVAAYWSQLNAPTHISTSHYTLAWLVRTYGQTAVDAALKPHIDAERAMIAARELATVRAFYADYGIAVPPHPQAS